MGEEKQDCDCYVGGGGVHAGWGGCGTGGNDAAVSGGGVVVQVRHGRCTVYGAYKTDVVIEDGREIARKSRI